MIFSTAPDWTDDPEVRLQMLTAIFQSNDNHEYRSRTREVAARFESYSFTTDGVQESTLAKGQIIEAMRGQVILPHWIDARYLGAAVLAGAVNIAIPTTDYNYKVGDYVVLWSNPWTCEAVLISGIADGLLTVDPLTQGWAANVRVMPGRVAWIPTQLKAGLPSGELRRFKVEFEIETVVTFGEDPNDA